MIFNNIGVQLGTLMIGGHTTSVSVGVANNDYYNITLTANTNCGTSTETSAGELCVYVCVCVCVCVRARACTAACMHECVRACVYVCMCVCVCVCLQLLVHCNLIDILIHFTVVSSACTATPSEWFILMLMNNLNEQILHLSSSTYYTTCS